MCTRVAAVAEEVVAEPPEPLEQAQQEERREIPAQGQVHPSSEQQLEGKPRCMSYYFKLWLTIYIYYLCITFQELFGTLVAWSLGPLELY